MVRHPFLRYVVWNDASLFSAPLIPLNDKPQTPATGLSNKKIKFSVYEVMTL
jgi:hypothetical protein